MRTYQESPSTTIPHYSYESDGFGNTIYHGQAAMRVARVEKALRDIDLLPGDQDFGWELSAALETAHKGWVDLDDSVGSDGLIVKVNLDLLQFFTYDAGRLCLVHCNKPEAFARRLAFERNHYEVRQPPYLLFIQDGREVVVDTRKGLYLSGMGVVA